MADWSAGGQESDRVVITTFDPENAGMEVAAGLASFAWPSANLCLFAPVIVHKPFLLQQLEVVVGSATSGNCDCGLVDDQQNRIISKGSTAVGSANAGMAFNVTDTEILPGLYFAALSCDNTTAAFTGNTDAVPLQRARGMLAQALGSVTIPNPVAFAAIANTFTPFISLLGRSLA